jgi:uncharacterized protein
MGLIYSLPASIKIAAAFAGILALYRLRVPLGWSVIINTAALTFLTGTGSAGALHLLHALLLPQNYLMLFVIILLTFFSDALSSTGKMENAVSAFRGVIKNPRLLAAGLPAIIGLLPMPGGALFSAPFLASTDEKNALLPEQKSAINYWFRHIWEYWWPLYPGVIMAIQCSGLPVGHYLLIMAPFTAASVVGGWLFMLRAIPLAHPGDNRERGRRRDALRTLWPIGLLVAISVAASALLPHAGVPAALANLYGMLAGLVVALAFVFGNDARTFRKSCVLFFTPATWSLVLVVASVLAFSAVLQIPLDAHNATLVSLMRDEFLRMGIPLIVILVLIPFISGLVTGISVAFVGAGFPIVFALIGDHPPQNVLLATTALAYASGYVGLMLSPVHICYIMSNEYFKTRFSRTYRYLIGPSATVAVSAVVLCGIYYFVFR